MTHSLHFSLSRSQVKTLGVLLFSFLFLFMFTSRADALLRVPDEADMIKIEESLVERVHPTVVINSAWFIDFPSEVKLSFIQVIALVGEDKVEKTFFLDPNTFELVDEALIESYREQEANSENPIFTITSGNKDLELQKDNSMFWFASIGALVVGFIGIIVLKLKQKSLN
jgi:Trk-type K+ transport system membrane component